MRRLALTPFLAWLASGVQAHPAHGAVQPWHWHAPDTVGFLTVAALAAIAIWFSRAD